MNEFFFIINPNREVEIMSSSELAKLMNENDIDWAKNSEEINNNKWTCIKGDLISPSLKTSIKNEKKSD